MVLKLNRQIRGCVGSIEPIRPFGEDVVENAFAAAFCDRHFTPLADSELDQLQIDILVVSDLQRLPCANQLELIQQLRPQLDGLLIRDGSHHANLLPTAWENYRTPLDFINRLKHQAGLPLTYWSKNTQIYRYTIETISDQSTRSATA